MNRARAHGPRQDATAPGASTSTAPGGDAARQWLVAAGVFVFALLVYANTLGHSFVWDDPIWLEQKIRFYRGPLDAFVEPPGIPSMRVYRPLSQLTYWLDQSIWWRNPLGFHLTSVLLHAGNAVLVLALARTLGFGLVSATTAALLFAAHPVQTESVAWITSRVDVLATLCTLFALLAALRPSTPTTLAAVALASFGAAASKETGCVVPLLILATALLAKPGTRRAPPWVAAAASAVALLPYFLLRPADATTGIAPGSFGFATLRNVVGSAGYQVERLLLPVGFWPYQATVPTDTVTIALAVAGAIATAAALVLPDASGRRRFAVTWLLVATALPIAVVLADFSSTPVAEHRLYLATVGLALLAAVGTEACTARPAARLVVVGLGVLVLAAITVERNRHWRDGLTFWTAVTDRVQTESLPYMNLGLALADGGRSAEAETAYRRALDLNPSASTRQGASINLGLIAVERGELAEAERLFTQANAIAPHAIAYRGLGMIARKQAQAAADAGDGTTAAAELARARADLERALAINPRYHQAHYTLATVLYAAGQYRAALAEYQRVVELAGDTEAGRSAQRAAAELGAWLAAHPDAP